MSEEYTEIEELDSAKLIAAKYTKPELVLKTLASFEKLAEVLRLVAIALPDTAEYSPIENTLYSTAKAKEIRHSATIQLQELVKIYNNSVGEVNEE